jgi:ribosome maturation factor RimP
LDELEQIKQIASQVLTDNDLYLVDVELKGSTGNRVIWIYLESEKGNVSLDRCAGISREVNFLLDAAGWHGKKYTLNVSSPGLDRPLRDIRQYHSNIGRQARVTVLRDGTEVRQEGRLAGVTEEKITLVTENKKELEIPFSDIVETYIQASL